MHYNYFRSYSAERGRYTQADPIGLDGGFNRFGYVGGDPLSFADDEGLQKRSGAPSLNWGQGQLNFQGANLTAQIRQYQPNYSYTYASAPGQGFTAANVGQLQGVLQRLQRGSTCGPNAGSIRDVNAIGGDMNCVNCSIATDATLAGRPASALGGGPFRIDLLESLYGRKFGGATSIDSVTNSLLNAGNGARGIVYGAPTRGMVGHVFNVVNKNGVVRYLDGQSGGAAITGGYLYYQLIRTN